MPGGGKLLLVRARVVGCNLSHDVSQRLIANLQKEVKVIRHPAVGVQQRAISLGASGNYCVQEQPVNIDAENVLLMIAPQGDVIKTTRNMNAQSARHSNLLRQQHLHECRAAAAILRSPEQAAIVEIVSPHFPHPAP
jgi:hypothetical protein